jgi:small subunit ribosomal protein S8
MATSSDPVGDMLTMIRNGQMRRHRRVSVPHSLLKEGLAGVLKSEGYLTDFKVTADEKAAQIKTLHLWIKYDEWGKAVITGLKRVSRPGCRIFRGVDSLGKVLDGLGVSILSTSKGILSDRQARKVRVGGEILCRVW